MGSPPFTPGPAGQRVHRVALGRVPQDQEDRGLAVLCAWRVDGCLQAALHEFAVDGAL